MPQYWERAKTYEANHDIIQFYWLNVLPRMEKDEMDVQNDSVAVFVKKEGDGYRIYFRDGHNGLLPLDDETYGSYKKARKAAVSWMHKHPTGGIGWRGHEPSSATNKGYVEGDDLFWAGPTVTEVSPSGRPLKVACVRCGRDFNTGGLNGQGRCADCEDRV